MYTILALFHYFIVMVYTYFEVSFMLVILTTNLAIILCELFGRCTEYNDTTVKQSSLYMLQFNSLKIPRVNLGPVRNLTV